MVRWTLALYPRAWRDRYGSEVASLSEELIAEGDSTPWRAGLDLITGAAVERGRALAKSRRIAVVPAVAVLVAAAGTGWALDRPHPARTSTQAASLASVRCSPVPAGAVRVHGPGPARPRSSVVIPAQPGWKLSRAPGPAGQVRLKTGQVRPKGIWCITRLPMPCAASRASLPRPPAGTRALPGRLRSIRGGPPGRLAPVRPRTVPAQVRPRTVPAQVRPGAVPAQVRSAPGRWRVVPGGIMVTPGRCIVLPPRCGKKVAPPRGAIRAGSLPGPGWTPGPPLRTPATLRPATLRPVPGPAGIPAAVCVVAAGVA